MQSILTISPALLRQGGKGWNWNNQRLGGA